MDSRDSSNFSATANRNGDEDGFSSLAKESILLFESRKYAECVSVLKQLLQKKGNDLKILHNLAIAEFFRDGCSDTERLRGALIGVKKKCEELLCTSGEQVEPVNNVGNKSPLATKGSGTIDQLSGAEDASNIVFADEFDVSVVTHNIAVFWFHLHEYSRVSSVLNPLFHNIARVDEATAIRICLLFLDTSLYCQDAGRSVDIFNYLEKAFGVGCGMNQGDNGGAAQQQSTSLVAKSSSVPSGSSTTDACTLHQTVISNASENSLSRTLSEEALEYETMLETLDIGRQNIGRPTGLLVAHDISRNSFDRSIAAVDLKLELQLYKVQILLLTRNLKLVKREVKHAINVTRGRDSSMALFLKAQLEHARGNHRKAIKLLMASSNPTEMGFLSMFNNNLGCIYHQLGKFHTSSLFFSKALDSCFSLRKEKPLKLSTLSQDKSLLIMYNCGVQNLDCGKPVLAARCFQKASLVFYNQPLMWLRLAECCLMAQEKGLLTTEAVPSDRLEVRVNVIGKGKWRHLAVDEGVLKKGLIDFVERDGCFLGNDGAPKLSLSFARQCVLNALLLVNCSASGLPSNPSALVENESEGAASLKNSVHKSVASADSKASTISASLSQPNTNGDGKGHKGGGTSSENVQSSLSFYEETRRRENLMIKQILLVNLAFIELELENPLKALSAAKSLLCSSDCSRIIIFLSHVYAAEALCLLGRSNEAIELLSTYLSGLKSFKMPYNQEDLELWQAERSVDCGELNGGSVTGKTFCPDDSQGIKFLRPEVAQGTLFANFATLAALRGELEQAYLFVTKAMSIIPNSPETTLTAVYVDLMRGDSQGAISKLKQCNQVRFVPSTLPLDRANS